MNYELCKALKHVGFPQTQGTHKSWWDDRMAVKQQLFQLARYLNPDQERGFIKDPTLSELIEACGEDFAGLYATDDGYAAYTDAHELEQDGKTPKEAVAHLWLALNKDKF